MNLGLILGMIGVTIFSLTLPMTRIALVYMSPDFVAFGRSIVAGTLACAVLLWRWRRTKISTNDSPRTPLFPESNEWKWLGLIALGVVFGFPLFTSLALRELPASQGAVITGLLPLATAAFGTLINRQYNQPRFWLWAIVGSLLVVAYAIWASANPSNIASKLAPPPSKTNVVFMFSAIILGALGYASGARLSARLGGVNTICWALAISLPLNLFLLLVLSSWPAQASTEAWLAFGYVSCMSMFVGFFFWYNGLNLGGIARVSQVQLLQPFLTIGFASLINREALEITTIGFALAVLFTVFMGRKATSK